tara:strand:+ start:5869 stop:7677 length:1809 start_codon:yes stop_codon:yes gene_type:complete
MAATKLGVYNNALTLLGERKLAGIYEARTPRYTLDEVWNLGAVDYCLELAKPRFAHKTSALTSPATSSEHALDSVYTLPTDYKTIVGVYSDDELTEPIDRYLIEGRTIATNVATTIYLRYISNSPALSQWTPAFTQMVAAFLAKETASKLNASKIEETDKIWKERSALVLNLEDQKELARRPLVATQTLDAHWLEVYNGALRIIGQPEIVSDTDDSNRRIALDYALGASFEAVDACIEAARPKFAVETVALSSGATSSEHGYTEVHTFPANYMSLIDVFQDNLLDQPINRYFIEGRTIATNYASIYVRMLVNDSTNSEWTPAFKRLVSAYLAKEVAPQLLTVDPALEPSVFSAMSVSRNQAINRTIAEYESRLELATNLEGVKEPDVRAAAAAVTLDADWLLLYNATLEICGLDPILSAEDDSARRRAIDDAVNNKAVLSVLSLVTWNQAWKSVKLEADPDLDPEWGLSYVFAVPSDMERIDMVAGGEHFTRPVPYHREGDYFYADIDVLWIRYTSTDTVSSPGSWPTYFWNLVSAELARRISKKVALQIDRADVADTYKEYKYEAMSTDIQRNPPRVLAQGDWTENRFRGRRNSSTSPGRR